MVGTTAYDRRQRGTNKIDGITWRIADECDAETATVVMLNGEEKYFKGMDSRFEVIKGRNKSYDFNVTTGYDEEEFEYQILADCDGEEAEVFCSNCGDNGQDARPRIRFEEIIAMSNIEARQEYASITFDTDSYEKGSAELVIRPLSTSDFVSDDIVGLPTDVELPPGLYEITLVIQGSSTAKILSVGSTSLFDIDRAFNDERDELER
ncbi:MAG: hypothetical protein ABJF88_19650 [Rhodothermales bacterium]